MSFTKLIVRNKEYYDFRSFTDYNDFVNNNANKLETFPVNICMHDKIKSSKEIPIIASSDGLIMTGEQYSIDDLNDILENNTSPTVYNGYSSYSIDILLLKINNPYVSFKNIKIVNSSQSLFTLSHMFKGCFGLETIDVSNLDTYNVMDMSELFKDCFNLKTIDMSTWNTSAVLDMSGMFYGCGSLTSIDLSTFKTHSVTDMAKMFAKCCTAETINVSSFDTSRVTNMFKMFWTCTRLSSLNLSNFDTSNVIDMSKMFENCIELENIDISSFDTTNVKDMNNMFHNCLFLKAVDASHFNTCKITKMNSMFNSCLDLEELDVSSFDTSNVEQMQCMFALCRKIVTLDLTKFNLSGIKIYDEKFDEEYRRETYRMFDDCRSLKSIIGSHTLEEVESGNIVALKICHTDLDLSTTQLDRASILAVIKGLSNAQKTLTLGETLLAKITEADKKIATDKGWTIV